MGARSVSAHVFPHYHRRFSLARAGSQRTVMAFIVCPSCKNAIPEPDPAAKRVSCPHCRRVVERIEPPAPAPAQKKQPKPLELPDEPKPSSTLPRVATVAVIVFVLFLIGVAATIELGLTLAICFAVAAVLLPAYTASYLGRTRAIGSGTGFLLGLFLSFLGVLIVALYPEREASVKCPYCAERVKPEATVCKHCRRDI